MSHATLIRPLRESDLRAWTPLRDGDNAFDGRQDETALPPEVTQATWR